ncbi:hypothetical protein CQ10_30290 [Bradyrhizobium valentinum]|nr:hypothetical protein CQ10_30290 [Bradyrhizobium valentinum]
MQRCIQIERAAESQSSQKSWVRLSWLPLCILLAACSSGPEHPANATVSAPDPSKITESLKKVAAEAKLEEPHVISAPIRAHSISSVPWIICLRSGATELSKRRTLAVFYEGDKHVTTRMSVIVDRCESQAFTALTK